MQTTALQRINPLTYEQRMTAQSEARKRIAGDEPVFVEPHVEDFANVVRARYAPEVVRAINIFANIVMVAAFIPSALRIFSAGFELSTVSFGTESFALIASGLIGVCSVMLAEAGMIAFTLSMAITEDRAQRNVQAMAAITCALIAFVGNIHVVMRHEVSIHYVFTWLEALAPPALVLVAANVRKTQILHANELRHAAQQAYEIERAERKARYEEAVADHKRAYESAIENTEWSNVYANTLRETIWNTTRGAKREELRVYTAPQWRDLVLREMRADGWMKDAEAQAQIEAPIAVQLPERISEQYVERKPRVVRAANASGGAKTGIGERYVTQMQDGRWTLHCPMCEWETVKDARQPALAAFASHVRTHPELQRKNGGN